MNVQRRDLVFSFVQDKQLVGEFFIMLITPTKQSTINNETGFASPRNKPQVAFEKKLVPILDVMCLDTTDNLSFTIVLHDDCQMNVYDVADA